MAAKRSSGTPATVLLARSKVPHRILEYVHDAANQHYGDESVAALGIPAARVFKTLIAELGGADQLVCAVVPVSGQLNLKALAQAAGAKRAVRADLAHAERVTGYVAGGISPLGQRRQLPVWIDESALGYPGIIVSGGRRGLSVEIAAADLASLVGARFADLARP